MSHAAPKVDEKRNVLCLHAGCKASVTSPSPKAKFCKKHRQIVYKKNYLNRNLKLRAKYQASKTCFSGSSDPFDGQDLDDMLQQVLAQKRLDLMRSPTLVEFLQQCQREVKIINQKRVTQDLPTEIAQLKTVGNDVRSDTLSIKPSEGRESLSEDFPTLNAKKGLQKFTDETDLKAVGDSPVNVSNIINIKNTSGLNKVTCVGSKRKNPTDINSNVILNATSFPKILHNKTPDNFLKCQPERRSAFQETGAGDAKSLLAVRAVTQGQ